MRKFIVAAAFCFAAVSMNAQSISEAVNYSTNNYLGTARSMALGNAMTALGGDLGSIGINPAGSAVAPYSQFTISPGISVTSTNAAYSSWADEDYGSGYLKQQSNLTLPNMGLVFNFDSYRDRGLKSYSIGIVSNTTSSFLGGFNTWGYNDQTSFLGYLAANASPYSPSDLGNSSNFFNSNIPWNSLIAYQAGMIADAVGADGNPMRTEDGGYVYLGTTEGIGSDNVINLLGELEQNSCVLTAGSKQDLVMNFAMNFNDNLFVGFNLGMPVATYKYNEYFGETAVDNSQFAIEYSDGQTAYFNNAEYEYSQTTDLAGIYGKIGILYIAPGGFRFGAAIQTPTFMSVTDRWDLYGATKFTDSSFNCSAQPSDVNEYSYNLTTPARYNFGAAYTFWDKGLISVDVEMANYGKMRYSISDGYYGNDYDYFSVENDVNSNFARVAVQGRLGAEFKVVPSIALRAGYTYQTSPYCYRYDQDGYKYNSSSYLSNYDDFESGSSYLTNQVDMFKEITQTLSAGIGYDPMGTFYADFAIRRTFYPESYFNPYTDYINNDGTYTPEVAFTKKAIDAVLTLGWRF